MSHCHFWSHKNKLTKFFLLLPFFKYFFYKLVLKYKVSNLSCRTSPACFTPSTRLSTRPSTILLAAVRRFGSSCPWPLTPASGGGVVLRVRQVKLTTTRWAAALEKRGHSEFPPELPAVSSLGDMFVVAQKGARFRPVRALFLAVAVSLHPSHSMGFIFNDGGVGG